MVTFKKKLQTDYMYMVFTLFHYGNVEILIYIFSSMQLEQSILLLSNIFTVQIIQTSR